MERICAWCGRELGRAAEAQPQNLISHGLCEDCGYHLFAQLGMPLQQYLDGLAAPVVVVDPTGTVRTANRKACDLLEKERVAIEGYKGGDVFECVHAKLPEGCGGTIHCSGCTIRNTVMDTFRTGQSRLKVPAYLKREMGGEVTRVHFYISTERVGEVVLLRVDAVGGRPLW